MSTVYAANHLLIGLSARARQTKTARAVNTPEMPTSETWANSACVSRELPGPSRRAIRQDYECESVRFVYGRGARR